MSDARPDVVFLGHLATAEAYRDALAALRGSDLPPPRLGDVDRIVRRMAPIPICEVEITSTTGRATRGVYTDAFLLVDGPMQVRAHLKKVRRACAEAAALRPGVIVLGGFTSIVGEWGRLDLEAEHGVPFTTGNALTAAVLAAQVRQVAEPGAAVVVVGAAGDVGSGLCRLLHEDGDRLWLVGRNPAPVAQLAEELDGSTVADWDDAAPRADVVVLVASARPGAVAVDRVRPDAWVLDAGHPGNAGPGHPRCFRAGRVRFERPTRSPVPAFTSDGCRPGEHHACLAEGAALALEGRFESWSSGRGHITPARARAILDIAARHGLTPSRLG